MGNITWASTYQTKLKTIHYHQKHAARILRSLNALNVYQVNLYQHLNIMHKVSNNVAPLIFNDMFKKPSHKYPTNFSRNNFSLKKCSLISTKYSISFRGPKLWNEFLNTDEKQISSYKLFSRKAKSKLIDIENEQKKVFLKFRRNYCFKLICIFKYTQIQSFWGALVGGCFGGLCGGFVRERLRWSMTSIKLHGGFLEVVLRRGCSPVDLLRIFRDAVS